MSNYVLGDFAKAEQDWLDDLMRGVADGAPALASGDSGKFMNAVALRMGKDRNTEQKSGTKPAPKAEKPKSEAAEPQADERSPLQKLADKFRR